jgi:hypothetical protein
VESKLGTIPTQRGSPLEGFEFQEVEHWLAPQLARCPFEIKTAFDLFWWLNFTMKWQHVSLRQWTRRRALPLEMDSRWTRDGLEMDSLPGMQHFFMAPSFESWSLCPHNHSMKVGDPNDWRTYKHELKQFIYEFDGNVKYRDHKLKIGSLRQNECYIGAIDSEFNLLPREDLKRIIGDRTLLSSYEPPLARPLVWLSLIMPSTPRARDALRQRDSQDWRHFAAASVHDSTSLDASEQDWLVRVAGTQARSQMPSYVADQEMLSSKQLQDDNKSALATLLSLFPSLIRRSDGDLFFGVARNQGGRTAQQALPRDIPLHWPYVASQQSATRASPALMKCTIAGPKHAAHLALCIKPAQSMDGTHKDPQCTVVAYGHKLGRDALRVTLHNLVSTGALQLEIPSGSIFVPDDARTQTLITSSDTFIELAPGESVDLSLDAYCGISSRSVPNGGQMELTRYLAPHKVCESQHTVWTWSRPFEPPPLHDGGDDGGGGSGGDGDDGPSVAARDEEELLREEFPDEADALHADFSAGSGSHYDSDSDTLLDSDGSEMSDSGMSDIGSSSHWSGWMDSDGDGG